MPTSQSEAHIHLETFSKLLKRNAILDIGEQLVSFGGSVVNAVIEARKKKKDNHLTPVKAAFKEAKMGIGDKLNPKQELVLIKSSHVKLTEIISELELSGDDKELSKIAFMLNQANQAIATQLKTKAQATSFGFATNFVPITKYLAKLISLLTPVLATYAITKKEINSSGFSDVNINAEAGHIIHETMIGCLTYAGIGAPNEALGQFIDDTKPNGKILSSLKQIAPTIESQQGIVRDAQSTTRKYQPILPNDPVIRPVEGYVSTGRPTVKGYAV
jgi:hypothetical protein